MAATLLWYDLETFGTDPLWDRIGQFAAIRTNDSFEPVTDPIVTYCALTPDYVPHPDACLVTGITPQLVNEKGVREVDFAATIHAEMIVPNTCTVGFNSVRFDDQFVRALFYRNFYDPYEREYAHGNSRWDIIDLLRMCHDLRPDGIEWAYDDTGKPVFRLEALAGKNKIEQERAHDALSDVRTTIELARRVYDSQPRLFRFYFSLREKEKVRRIVNLQHAQPIVHTSRIYTSERGCTTLVLPLSVHPDQPNNVLCYDLRHNPSDWIDAPVDEIRRRVFSSASELEEGERIHFSNIHLNRCPAVSPIDVLSKKRAEKLGIDIRLCRKHTDVLRKSLDLIQKVRSVFAQDSSKRNYDSYRDPELRLYSGGFFGDEDRETIDRIRHTDPEDLAADPPELFDPRGPELLRRYLARNYYEHLDADEQRRWKSFCASRILAPEAEGALDFGTFRRDLKNRLSRSDTPAPDKAILKQLLEYADQLEKTVLK